MNSAVRMSHKLSGVSGFVDAVVHHPDGKILWRIDDHWFFAMDCMSTYSTEDE